LRDNRREWTRSGAEVKYFSSVRRIAMVCALAGMASTSALVAYQFLTHFTPFPRPLLVLFVTLCPMSLLSITFIDIEPGTGTFYLAWAIIALLNSGLYALIGATVARRLAKRSLTRA
jgi:hypothetical protein